MSFQDAVLKDIKNVFINTSEFAHPRTIRYDGKTYKNIDCVVHTFDDEDRNAGSQDHMEGLRKTSTYLHCAYEDFPHVPEHGSLFALSDLTSPGYLRQFYVQSASFEEGMLHITLEAIDE